MTAATARRATAVIIGGGHAGLAMSRCLGARSVDHVVLDRGTVAHSWKTERWDSLRLLTPNWLSRLPDHEYSGDDPDGFMPVSDVIDFIEGYAATIDAPIVTETTVTSVVRDGDRYQVVTDQGTWRCAVVVLASGACNVATVPDFAAEVPPNVTSINPLEYRNPDQLDDGRVLVVGASATGLQLADEIHRSGRPVTLSVGNHVRLPRTYRGRDIHWWLEVSGVNDERFDEVDDVVRARNVPSPQLVGTPEHKVLDLNTLMGDGVEVRGRLGAVRDGTALFSGGLRNQCALADLKMDRLLDTVDEWARGQGHDEPDEPERHPRTDIGDAPLMMDMADPSVSTIVWATGFTPDHSWLDVPVTDHKGRVRHEGGVVDSPGMYMIGSTFLRRRKSSFIHGAGDDANELADHLVEYLASAASATA